MPPKTLSSPVSIPSNFVRPPWKNDGSAGSLSNTSPTILKAGYRAWMAALQSRQNRRGTYGTVSSRMPSILVRPIHHGLF
jgi:hypothetical protein